MPCLPPQSPLTPLCFHHVYNGGCEAPPSAPTAADIAVAPFSFADTLFWPQLLTSSSFCSFLHLTHSLLSTHSLFTFSRALSHTSKHTHTLTLFLSLSLFLSNTHSTVESVSLSVCHFDSITLFLSQSSSLSHSDTCHTRLHKLSPRLSLSIYSPFILFVLSL